MIKGHEIEVVFAQERRKTPREMRGRGPEDGEAEEQQPAAAAAAAPPSRDGERRGGGGGFER